MNLSIKIICNVLLTVFLISNQNLAQEYNNKCYLDIIDENDPNDPFNKLKDYILSNTIINSSSTSTSGSTLIGVKLTFGIHGTAHYLQFDGLKFRFSSMPTYCPAYETDSHLCFEDDRILKMNILKDQYNCLNDSKFYLATFKTKEFDFTMIDVGSLHLLLHISDTIKITRHVVLPKKFDFNDEEKLKRRYNSLKFESNKIYSVTTNSGQEVKYPTYAYSSHCPPLWQPGNDRIHILLYQSGYDLSDEGGFEPRDSLSDKTSFSNKEIRNAYVRWLEFSNFGNK